MPDAAASGAPKAKKKVVAAAPVEWGDEWEEEEAWQDEEEPARPAKKAKKVVVGAPSLELDAPVPKKKKAAGRPAAPTELTPGTVVLYWGGLRGVVRDAFVPIDQFWLTDEATGDVVADEAGEIVQFKAAELRLLAGPPVARPRPADLPPLGGVLLVAQETAVLQVLSHFGSPDPEERCEPQQLLAIPCEQCDPQSILRVASDGVDDSSRELAKRLRPDIHMTVRDFHLKEALEQLGGDLLRLTGFYCLASVRLPWSQEDIAEPGLGDWEREWRGEVCNQIDLGVTACGAWPGEGTPEAAAKHALGECCGIDLSDDLWDAEVQRTIRRRVGCEHLPLQFTDANGMRVTVALLPEDTVSSENDGTLFFDRNPKDVALSGRQAATAAGNAAPPASGRSTSTQARSAPADRKTALQWEEEQHKFAGHPELPPDWIRVVSKSSGDVYYWNKKTQQSTFDPPEVPLPPGWTKQVSKSTGKAYYFHAAKKQSQFHRPTA